MQETFTQSMWDQTLDQLKGTIDDDAFATWLRPTRFYAVRENTLVLSVPSLLYKNWLQANYRDQISRAVQRVFDRPLDIDFQIEVSDDSAPRNAGAVGPLSAEVTRTLPLNSKYTFDNFVVGENNRFAHAACRQVADPNSKSYNPLLLYGTVGLGKTHLMHAIGHMIHALDPQKKIVYVTSEQFMNSFIEAIAQGQQLAFRHKYRNADLLLIDDIQFFGGKERTQEEFFHTFNALYDVGKKIVITSDRHPRQVKELEDRLVNRLEWGLQVDIQPPDMETRLAILRKKSNTDGTQLPNDVAAYIAERVQSNIRELEGVLVRLRAYANLKKEPISLKLAEEILGRLLTREIRRDVDLDQIMDEVCRSFNITRAELIGASRLKKYSTPRHIAQYLARVLTPLSYPEIGNRFGGRDHTSVLHAFRKIEHELTQDEHLKNLVTYLQNKLSGNSLAG